MRLGWAGVNGALPKVQADGLAELRACTRKVA